MITYYKHLTSNGLSVILHQDNKTPLVASSVLYRAGSKYEQSDRTGMAHLMEHLMFSGTHNTPDFDIPIQEAGGENNAYTNSDIAHYYNVAPATNLETLLWLESDRMINLNLSENSFKNQQKVVLEEFYETCLNQPYGDSWHHLTEMAYPDHPYQWPTIGKNPEHIRNISIQDIRKFYNDFYDPSHAILSISGNIDINKTKDLVDKWFGSIPVENLNLPTEKTSLIAQPVPSRKEVVARVPSPAIYIAYKMGSRTSHQYYVSDVISDLLSNGRTSRLFKNLYKKKQVVSMVDAYITGTEESGLLIIEARPEEGVSLERVEEEIKNELSKLTFMDVKEEELQKRIHKINAAILYSETQILNNVINLAYYEHIGDIDLINNEISKYSGITAADIRATAIELFQEDNCVTLIYKPEATK